MKYLNVIPLTIIAFMSCQQEKHSLTQCELYVRFEETTQKIVAEATLFQLDKNNKNQPLKPEGGVSFMGSNMESNELPGGKIRYRYEYQGTLPKSMSLAWNNPDGGKSTVSVEALSVGDFQLTMEQGQHQLIFEGQPLAKDETLTLLFTDAKRKMVNISVDGPSSSNTLSIDQNALRELASGKGQLSLVRTKTYANSDNNIATNITFSFYSKVEDVDL